MTAIAQPCNFDRELERTEQPVCAAEAVIPGRAAIRIGNQPIEGVP